MFRVGHECPVREVGVQCLHHHMELVRVLAHAGSSVLEKVQIRSHLGWLGEPNTLDLVQSDDAGDGLTILFGQSSIPFEIME